MLSSTLRPSGSTPAAPSKRSEEHTSELQSRLHLVCRLLLETQNSSIGNGARVVRPSVAGMMIGAVGVATCPFLHGISFVAAIVGWLVICTPNFDRKIQIRSP